MSISPAGLIVDTGAIAFCYLALQMPATTEWLLTPERVLSTAGLLLVVGFYGGRLWKDFIGSKGKI